jgi:hypothetical protein
MHFVFLLWSGNVLRNGTLGFEAIAAGRDIGWSLNSLPTYHRAGSGCRGIVDL